MDGQSVTNKNLGQEGEKGEIVLTSQTNKIWPRCKPIYLHSAAFLPIVSSMGWTLMSLLTSFWA